LTTENPFPIYLAVFLAKFLPTRGYVSKQLADKLLKEFGIEFFALASSQYEKQVDAPS
jgi:hypothetical protein